MAVQLRSHMSESCRVKAWCASRHIMCLCGVLYVVVASCVHGCILHVYHQHSHS